MIGKLQPMRMLKPLTLVLILIGLVSLTLSLHHWLQNLAELESPPSLPRSHVDMFDEEPVDPILSHRTNRSTEKQLRQP
jgi:hypothetical protein